MCPDSSKMTLMFAMLICVQDTPACICTPACKHWTHRLLQACSAICRRDPLAGYLLPALLHSLFCYHCHTVYCRAMASIRWLTPSRLPLNKHDLLHWRQLVRTEKHTAANPLAAVWKNNTFVKSSPPKGNGAQEFIWISFKPPLLQETLPQKSTRDRCIGDVTTDCTC